MKTSTWLGIFSFSTLAALAWYTHQPETAQATLPAAAGVVQSSPAAPEPDPVSPYTDAGFHEGEAGLSPSARSGREIWFKATAGNARFHTYTFQQRITALIDWFGVLRSDARDTRFKTWGLINDPGCCKPGSDGCPARSYEETYGFDWCPGDQELLKFVGKPGYRDPACDFKDASVDASDPEGHQKGREDSCNLAFGTSTGALGFRKFPNPRFDAAVWKQVNGSPAPGKATTANCRMTPPAPTPKCASWPMPRSNPPS